MSCEFSGKKQSTLSQKILYNQKVKQDLICKLLEFIRCHDSTSLPNSISSKYISDIPVDANITSGSVSHLAHLFDKAEKTGWKEKLRYSENNISDQMARMQIYDEMELYLSEGKQKGLPSAETRGGQLPEAQQPLVK
ncbi:12577_t:CDS:2 [Funneliformis mosseae]|uniref:12577_t:CDS:1 n=1 Tax=Funneliformis mosseae TaxID=27381 RepID=A0A9N8Z887_FUNMO|nr:12577_t:CDS:2 [Funneliformis mosseae]